MKNNLIAIALLIFISNFAFSQSNKTRIFGEVGLGAGQAFINSSGKASLETALGGTFEPAIGNNLMMAFYVSPEKWKGLGIGSRIQGTFGSPTDGTNNSSYVFNYYNLSLAAKYFVLSQEFNKGLYVNGSFGFGQFTAKRLNESTNEYQHQYAIGTSLMAGMGYTFPFKKNALSIEVQYENANRSGTVDRIGEVSFGSGQIGGNIILSF
ncbi:hypothetical protein SAMN05661096_03585 [Marivirga sericea]|uniref:Outer membrane protein beta-barrel domain-containing protein n=1 Tax=Marivirga sericea TaxID=1028 RepID=A0A1X7L5V7_9BACT|nr:hypothetical protein [Marivirga sericea]SMG49236.1 hypothetical protein SAMN05661096_03585 [Marivirga sericea]